LKLFIFFFKQIAGNEDGGGVSSKDNGAAIKERHVSRRIFLTTMMHAGRYYVPAITPVSSSYKSQRKE